MDEDLDRMSREQLVLEARKLRDGVRRHRDSTGQDLCWHHPALWGLLPEKTDPIPEVPDWPEFMRGCVQYRQSLDQQVSPAHATPRSNRTTLYLVFRDPARAWVAEKPTREQPLWDEHAVFMDRLFDQGRVVLAGPYDDSGRALVVVNARDARDASELFRDDPWTTGNILGVSNPIAWTIFLDSRTRAG